MSILDQARWPDLAPFIKIQPYTREGGTTNPRCRIELMNNTPDRLVEVAERLTMPCVACGAVMHPFRARNPTAKVKNIYFACACSLDVNKACSRGNAAKTEYEAVKVAISDLQAATEERHCYAW